MSLPKEPRQKMINLMYLVLTAMLALNVSAEILNAFKTVDNSLTNTNKTVNNSTETILASLNEKRSEPATAQKANYWYPKAQQAQSLSKGVMTYIDGLKKEILVAADFNPAENGDSSFKMDDLDIATRIMVNEGKGKKLQQMLSDYKKQLLAIDPLIAKEFEKSLQIDLSMPRVQDKGLKTWELAYFHMVPTVAAVTILSKFQNDVKTSENRVVAFAHEQVGKVAVRFDTYAAIVGQSSNYVMPGQEIEITAGVGAFSKAAAPSITINGQNAALGEDGAAHAKFAGGAVGNKTIPVRIAYTDQEGKPQVIEKTISYTVGQANASIALDKMNVLYIGVDNPVTIAASGGGDDRVNATLSGGGGSIRRVGSGKWIARVNTISDNAIISVTVDGKQVGASQFRVRTIPDPVATVGNFSSGDNVPAGAFKAQAGVGAFIRDFPFDLKYTVTSFTMTGDGEGFDDIVEASNQGNAWGPQAQGIMRRVRPGSFITIENIRAIGPDGRTRKIPSLLYNIK
ncbi:MAG: gliding motility protein GldM [Chitinophagaceae bacterium]